MDNPLHVPFEVDGAPAVLRCPVCGESFLHHDIVEVFDREPDAKEGLHVTVAAVEVKVDGNMRHNPSRRRNGLRISFWCETCNARPRLDIVQHKGSTLVCWANGSEIGAKRDGGGNV